MGADFLWLSHLFDIGIIKENPLRGFGVVREGTVMSAGVTDHANQQQLALLRALIRDTVKQLQKHTNKHKQSNHNTKHTAFLKQMMHSAVALWIKPLCHAAETQEVGDTDFRRMQVSIKAAIA